MKFKLVRVADGTEIPVTAMLLVGRLEECGLRLTQGLPSRRHAQVTIVDQCVWVEDLGSVNGTYINGNRITAKSVLQPGDHVRFDVEEFHLQAVLDTQSAPTMYRPLAQEVASMQAANSSAPKAAPSATPVTPNISAHAPGAIPVNVPSQPSASGLHRKLDIPKESAEPRIAKEPKAGVGPDVSGQLHGTPQSTGAMAEPRKVEAPAKIAEPAAKAAEIKSDPILKSAEASEGSGLFKRPGAWADPDSDDGANKTKFMDPAALKGALAQRGSPPVAAMVVTSPCLVLLSGATRGTKIDLQAGVAEWTIGSGADCQLQLSDAGVSSLHAKLINDGKRWKLIDQMSANGTYVNGKRSNVSYLNSEDRLGFGPVECELRLPGGGPARNTSTAVSEEGGRKMLYVAAAVVAAVIVAVAAWLLI